MAKILTLGDRNPHSPTYGCFDRNFWQYKIVDFPSGMSQEFVLPLALAWQLEIPGNPYYQQPNLRAWAIAGMHYAAKSAHGDGSCDDYFPFERAGGAAAFSLLACVDAYEILKVEDPDLLEFFGRRADWLAAHHESGRLANHQALIALVLERLGRLTGRDRWREASHERLNLVLSWQSEEGWFQEYEGCDPGYHTLTISCLARLYDLQCQDERAGAGGMADTRLRQALVKAVELAAQFVHPDGSYGGEYTSRNTYNFFPHGFELVGRWLPEALAVNDGVLRGLEANLGACYSDDHIIGHHTWNYLLAWRDFVVARPRARSLPLGRVWLPEARLLVDRRKGDDGRVTTLYLALNKGGAFKVFRGDRLVASDTQFSLQVRQGKKLRNAVGHLVDAYEVQLDENAIAVGGKLGWAKQTQMTPLKLLILRVGMLSFGRFFPNLVRRVLQRLLIVGKQETDFRFLRRLSWTGSQWFVTDDLRVPDWDRVESVGIGPDQTSIYVVMSRTFQSGQLQPWLDLTGRVRGLSQREALQVERHL
ncbi:MAG: hypothetical protein Fur0042_30750 [Cyanophyceae cyanobacterium]